MQFQVDAYIQF
ncbi:unnamed protein product, partial [Rotaria magnacalcarata]